MSKTIVMPNDFGYAGRVYDEMPRGNEIFDRFVNHQQARPQQKVSFRNTVTEKDRTLIRKAVSSQYYTQIEISKKIGVTVDILRSIMNGNGKVFGKEVFLKVTNYLGITDKIECLK